VSDDSAQSDVRRDCQQLLASIKASYSATFRYAGLEDRQRYAEALACETQLPFGLVRFGLCGERNYSITTGASRNALLLDVVGETMLQVDDDTICQVSPVPEQRSGLALSSQFDPTEFWPFVDGAQDTADASDVVDFLAVHEELLGKSPSQCLGDFPVGPEPDLAQAGLRFFRKLQSHRGRVLVTSAGVVGDSGLGSGVYLLALDGRSRERLVATEAHYRQTFASRQVLRAVTRATVCDAAFCMALNLGLDNRQLLPPFLPVQRNQDGVFAALLRAGVPDSLFGFLPWLLRHEPPARPPLQSSNNTVWAAGEMPCGQIIQALVQGCAPSPISADSGQNLRTIGRTLGDWGRAPSQEFLEFVRLQLWGQMSRMVVRFRTLLRRSGGNPGFWAGDVDQVLSIWRQQFTSAGFGLPSDLLALHGVDQTLLVFQDLVRKFGELVQVWPDLHAGAHRLKEKGVRLSRSI
jgi:hypothetical protein